VSRSFASSAVYAKPSDCVSSQVCLTSRVRARLHAPESPAVVGAEIESETRRGRDFVRVTITAAVDAVDVAAALSAAWDAFRQAAGDDAGGWDVVAASGRDPA